MPLAAMHKIAERLGCSHMEVYEVATFYTMFHKERVGKFFIQLCGTTPCMACGAEKIKATIEELFPGIQLPPLPEHGDLDLEDVRKGRYFFS